jgi:CRP-like cAMP-binding protein
MSLNSVCTERQTLDDACNNDEPAVIFTGGSRSAITRHLHVLRDYGVRVCFARDDTIFSEGNPAAHVHRVVAGCIRLYRRAPDGRRHIADFVVPGDVVGIIGQATYPYTAEAVTAVTLVAYPRSLFNRLSEADARLRADLLQHLSTSLRQARRQQFVAARQDAKGRLASFILTMVHRVHDQPTDRIEFTVGRQDIADHLGLTFEAVCRAIAALKSEGFVAVADPHRLVLRDLTALCALAESQNRRLPDDPHGVPAPALRAAHRGGSC